MRANIFLHKFEGLMYYNLFYSLQVYYMNKIILIPLSFFQTVKRSAMTVIHEIIAMKELIIIVGKR